MKAFCICKKLMKAITDKAITEGCVYSVFDNACNIDTGYELITLLNREKEMAPMSVIIENGGTVNFKQLNLTRHMAFNFNQSSIHCDSINLFIDLEGSREWFSGIQSRPEKCQEKDFLENIAVLEQGIGSYCKHDGISPVIGMLGEEMPELGLAAFNVSPNDKIIRFIKYRFLSFIKAAAVGDTDSIAQKAGSVIGFGSGLTPAMDDLISGIMISYIYLADYYNIDIERINRLNRRMISEGSGRTTRVSMEMLRHSAEGETNQAAKVLMLALLDSNNEQNIINALIRNVRIGETSGSDMVLGIYIGCKIMTNYKFRGEWLNESMCGHQERKLL